jgi:hypothetical protein
VNVKVVTNAVTDIPRRSSKWDDFSKMRAPAPKKEVKPLEVTADKPAAPVVAPAPAPVPVPVEKARAPAPAPVPEVVEMVDVFFPLKYSPDLAAIVRAAKVRSASQQQQQQQQQQQLDLDAQSAVKLAVQKDLGADDLLFELRRLLSDMVRSNLLTQ